jgi:hypothetical protein
MTTEAPPRTRMLALLGWLSIAVSVVAWTSHLFFTGIWVEVSGRGRGGAGSVCETGPTAPFHLATVVTALLALVALAMSLHVYRRRDAVEPVDPRLPGQLRFLGLLGIGAAIFNLVLILWEGSYVFFLGHCG